MEGSDFMGAIGILVLVVFGSQYIQAEAGADIFFSAGILDLALMGICVIVIAVAIYSNLKDL